MSALERLMYSWPIRRDAEAERLLDLKIEATRMFSLTGTTVASQTWGLHLAEGAPPCIDALLLVLDCCHRPGEHRMIERRAIVAREFEGPTAARVRLMPVEAQWLDRELGRESPDHVRLRGLLSWSAFRQAETAVSCQGELAWRAKTEFPDLRLN